jgi:hypothetical protein
VVAHEAPVSVDLEELRLEGASASRVDQLFTRLGFQTLRDRIERWA